MSVYGYCPYCGAKGIIREKRINGFDDCENGHRYPSRNALEQVPDSVRHAGIDDKDKQFFRALANLCREHGVRHIQGSIKYGFDVKQRAEHESYDFNWCEGRHGSPAPCTIKWSETQSISG